MTSQTYPGLRPYTDEESCYFFGRKVQVDDIILRLGSNQRFVAVVGGSGSGKSSLIRAGVIPSLRSYSLSSSGGAWLPIIFTPGTNAESEEQGCLFRMAAAMLGACGLDRDSPDFCIAQQTFVQTLRNSDSSCTLDTLTSQLTEHIPTKQYPAPKKTNVLYVVDQFEELFHSTNRSPVVGAITDAQHLIKHLVDHAQREQPEGSRAYVVITMRSEHLDECPAYDKLVDIINKGFFLLRNLEDKELLNAIELPARHALSVKWSEADGHSKNLPETVLFSDDLKKLLVEATREIRQDWRQNNQSRGADQLPLLQHALFRIWEEANKRAEAEGFACPAEVTLNDFAKSAGLTCTPTKELYAWRQALELADTQPLLAGFLDYNCEKIWRDIEPDVNPWVELAFRRLAFVDDGGNFTQERISLRRLASISRDGKSIDEGELRNALAVFIKPHAYLSPEYGDGEDWDRAKVAHESLVRGWRSFGRWVTEEAERYRALDHFIEQARNWSREGRKFLLSTGDLERAKEREGLPEIFNIEDNWIRFGRFRRTPPGEPAEEPKLLQRFLDASTLNSRLSKAGLWSLVIVALVAAGSGCIWLRDRARNDILGRTAEYYRASTIAFSTITNFSDLHQDFFEPLVPLKQALIAAQLVGTTRLNHRVEFGGISWFSEQIKEELTAEGVAERVSAEGLRRILTGSIWPVFRPTSEPHAEDAKKGSEWCPSHTQWCLTYANRSGSDSSDELRFVNADHTSILAKLLPPDTQVQVDSMAGYLLATVVTGGIARSQVYEINWAAPSLVEVLNIPADKFKNNHSDLQNNSPVKEQLPPIAIPRSWGTALPSVIGNRPSDEDHLPTEKTEDVPIAIAFNQIDTSVPTSNCLLKFTDTTPSSKTCIEVRYYSNASFATVFRAPDGQGDMQRLGLLSFNSANVDRAAINWKIIDEPPRESGVMRGNDKYLGWVFIPLNRKTNTNENDRKYLASPWSAEAWFEIGKKIYTQARGCVSNPYRTSGLDLELRYSIDYKLIRDQSKALISLETELCPK